MVMPVNSNVRIAESVGSNFGFYTIRSSVDFTPATGQATLNKMIEVISFRGQPVILNLDPVSTETDPADLPGATGSVSVYTLKFAVEHEMAWEAAGPTALKDALVESGLFTADTVSVTFHSTM